MKLLIEIDLPDEIFQAETIKILKSFAAYISILPGMKLNDKRNVFNNEGQKVGFWKVTE